MKPGPIDVISGALYSVFGRVFLTGLVVFVSGFLSLKLQMDEPLPNSEILSVVVPMMIFSVFRGIGLVTVPAMLGFTLLFVRYEWRLFLLIVPAMLSFITVASVTG